MNLKLDDFVVSVCLRQACLSIVEQLDAYSDRGNAHDEVVKEKRNGTVRRIGIFVNTSQEVLYEWVVCGHTFERRASEVVSHHGFPDECPQCRRQSAFDEKLAQVLQGKVKRIEGFVTVTTPILFGCLVCGHEFTTMPQSLVRVGFTSILNKCPECEHLETTTRFDVKLDGKFGGVVLRVGQYTNSITSTEFRNLNCGHEFNQKPGVLLSQNGSACPICNLSNGEQLVRLVLEDLKIPFTAQKTFDGLVNVRKLQLDIYFEFGDQAFVVEWHGRQHYEDVATDYFRPFYETRELDEIKYEYCSSNDINLIEIPYIANTYPDIREWLIRDILSYLGKGSLMRLLEVFPQTQGN